jgi:hypothetical protein
MTYTFFWHTTMRNILIKLLKKFNFFSALCFRRITSYAEKPAEGGAAMTSDNKKDTFFVRREDNKAKGPLAGFDKTTVESLTFPDGRKVHALDRSAFEKGLRAATNKE